MMIIFGGMVFFLRNFEIFTQNQLFSIYYHELSVFMCVITMDKSMFCTLR